MLAEVVVPTDGRSTEVAHLGPAAAGHAVAAFGLDEARPTLVAFPDAGSGHLLLNRCPVLDVILLSQFFTGEAIVLLPEPLTLPAGLLGKEQTHRHSW